MQIVGQEKKDQKKVIYYQYAITIRQFRSYIKISLESLVLFVGVKEKKPAVDDKNGLFVYVSDEGCLYKKYHGRTSMGTTELAVLVGEYFLEDIRKIAIANYPRSKWISYRSNNKKVEFNIFFD